MYLLAARGPCFALALVLGKTKKALSWCLTRQTRFVWDLGHLVLLLSADAQLGLTRKWEELGSDRAGMWAEPKSGRHQNLLEQRRPSCGLCSLLGRCQGASDPSQTPNLCLGAPAGGIRLPSCLHYPTHSPGYRAPFPVLAGGISSLSWGQEGDGGKGGGSDAQVSFWNHGKGQMGQGRLCVIPLEAPGFKWGWRVALAALGVSTEPGHTVTAVGMGGPVTVPRQGGSGAVLCQPWNH